MQLMGPQASASAAYACTVKFECPSDYARSLHKLTETTAQMRHVRCRRFADWIDHRSIGGCRPGRRHTLRVNSHQYDEVPHILQYCFGTMIDESDLAEVWVRLSRSHDSSLTTAAFVLAALLISIVIIKVSLRHRRSRTSVPTGLLQCQNIQHSGNN